MIRFNSLDKTFTLDKSFCGKCKQKICSNSLEPVLFSHDYFHFNCVVKRMNRKYSYKKSSEVNF